MDERENLWRLDMNKFTLDFIQGKRKEKRLNDCRDDGVMMEH